MAPSWLICSFPTVGYLFLPFSEFSTWRRKGCTTEVTSQEVPLGLAGDRVFPLASWVGTSPDTWPSPEGPLHFTHRGLGSIANARGLRSAGTWGPWPKPPGQPGQLGAGDAQPHFSETRATRRGGGPDLTSAASGLVHPAAFPKPLFSKAAQNMETSHSPAAKAPTASPGSSP